MSKTLKEKLNAIKDCLAHGNGDLQEPLQIKTKRYMPGVLQEECGGAEERPLGASGAAVQSLIPKHTTSG